MDTDHLLDELRKTFPPVLYRTNPKFRELTGLHPRTLANLDALGRGPAERVLLGKTVGYPREALLGWLAERLRVEHRRSNKV